MILGNTKARILQYLEFKGISKPQFYAEVDIKRGLLDSDKMNSTVTDAVIAKILVAYSDINPIWLLIGEGSMLQSDQHEESTHPTPATQSSSSSGEAAAYYNMYREKDAKVEELLKENGRLEERIRQLESQDKEPDHHTRISETLEAFTSELSGDYGEGSLPMKKSTTSKRLSDGKM